MSETPRKQPVQEPIIIDVPSDILEENVPKESHPIILPKPPKKRDDPNIRKYNGGVDVSNHNIKHY